MAGSGLSGNASMMEALQHSKDKGRVEAGGSVMHSRQELQQQAG
jgi:hypothetical protein